MNLIADVNKLFNTGSVSNGIFEFAIDSLYQFATPINTQITLPAKGYDYRVIIPDNPQVSFGYWYPDQLTVYHYYTAGVFSATSYEDLAWELALARGCFALQFLDIDADKNSVNHKQYTVPIASFMYNCHGPRTWDSYSTSILAYHKDTVFKTSALIGRAIPRTIFIRPKKQPLDTPTYVRIDVYGVRWATYTVSEPPIIQGISDVTGAWKLPKNPFADSTGSTVLYPNLLIRSINASDTAYTIFPIYEAGNAYFADPDTVLIKQL